MAIFEVEVFGNSLLRWLIAAAVALVVMATLMIARRLIAGRVDGGGAIASVAKPFAHTRLAFLFVVGLYAGVQALDLASDARRIADAVMVVALVVQGALWATMALSGWIARATAHRVAEGGGATALSALATPLKLVIWALAALIALGNLGIDISALIAGLGIGGIAVALAVQNIMGDLFASLSIAFDRPFEVGDFIVVGDQLGTVERIGLRSTRVRALSGEAIVFPNSDLLASRINNYKTMRERRVVFGLGVVYQTPVETVEAIPGIVRAAIEAEPNTRFDRGHFKGFGPSSLDFEFVYAMTVPDYNAFMDTQQAVNLAIMRRFAEAGIDFAYPTTTVFLAGGSP